MRPVLDVADLTVRYGETVALRDVSLRIDPGEIVALVGPNGAGKSTLLRAVMGLVRHDGTVAIHTARPRRTAVAFVPQHADVDLGFPITVEQVVSDGRRPFTGPWRPLRRGDRRAIAEAIGTVGLGGFERRPIGALSGGQLQRTFIGRALAMEAELMLLDEPLTGVDEPAGVALMDLLHMLAGRGHTIVVSTHDLSQVRERFARCIVLNRRVFADSAPVEALRAEHVEAVFLTYA